MRAQVRSVLHKTKKIGIAVSKTHDAENVATVKASEDAVYGCIILTSSAPHDSHATSYFTSTRHGNMASGR